MQVKYPTPQDCEARIYESATPYNTDAIIRAAIDIYLESVEDAKLPCDVRVAPATTIRAGCKISTLLMCIDSRNDADAPYKFPPLPTTPPASAE